VLRESDAHALSTSGPSEQLHRYYSSGASMQVIIHAAVAFKAFASPFSQASCFTALNFPAFSKING